jgi:hypothetical protein
MSSPETNTTTTGSTLLQGVIILILLIAAIAIIVIYLRQPASVPLPLSPFVVGDVLRIKPAVLCKTNVESTQVDPNQYFKQNVCPTLNCPNCLIPNNVPGDTSCTVTLTGAFEDEGVLWKLQQFFADCGGIAFCGDSDQSLSQSGDGNRFYLKVNGYQDNDPKGRLTYAAFNMNPGLVSGNIFPQSSNPTPGNVYSNDMLIYFLPTSQPNLYYLFFPGFIITSGRPQNSPNSGFLQIQPYANPTNTANYNPYTNGQLNLNSTVQIAAPEDGKGGVIFPPYLTPWIQLFEVTKV